MIPAVEGTALFPQSVDVEFQGFLGIDLNFLHGLALGMEAGQVRSVVSQAGFDGDL